MRPLPPMTVSRSATGYVVFDPEILRLMGSFCGADVLPLPFTPEAEPQEVVAHLRRINPHRDVRFDPVALDA